MIKINKKIWLNIIIVLFFAICVSFSLAQKEEKIPKLALEKKITVDFPGDSPSGSLYITDDEYILYKTSEKFYTYGGELEFYDKKWNLKSKIKIAPKTTVIAISENGKFIGESTFFIGKEGPAVFRAIFTLKDRNGNVIWEKKIPHQDVVISNNGNVVMTGCGHPDFPIGSGLYFFDKKGNLVKEIRDLTRTGIGRVSKDGKIILAAGWTRTENIYESKVIMNVYDDNGNVLFSPPSNSTFIKFSKNDEYLIFQNRDGSISYYDRRGNIVENIELDEDEINFIKKDDKNKKFNIFNLKSGKIVKEFELEELVPDLIRTLTVKVFNDKKTIVVYGKDNTGKKNIWVLKLK